MEDILSKNKNYQDLFDNLYSKNITIEDKNKEHYDMKNPLNLNNYSNIIINTNNETNNQCKGEYELLPEYWINKLKDPKYRIYKTNHASCIFTLIKSAKETFYNNEFINDLKISITTLLMENKNVYRKKNDKKELWELTKIAYQERYKKTNFNTLFDVETKNEFFDAVKNNEREITDIDLSFISYLIGVKFIILCDPSDKKCKSGIKCLGTTQTNSEYYILLFKNSFDEYYMIYDNSYVKDKSIFRRDEIEDIIIYETWKAECSETDDNLFINKINDLYKPDRYIYNFDEIDGKFIEKSNESIEISSSKNNSYSDDEFESSY